MAFLWHYRYLGIPGPGNVRCLWLANQYSIYGVDFFFILSGMVFSYVYLEPIRSRSIKVGAYIRRRFARLYPIHLLTLLVCAGLLWRHGGPLFAEETNNTSREFVGNLLFVQGGWFWLQGGFNFPSWSLSVEEVMYALFYASARFGLDELAGPLMALSGYSLINATYLEWTQPLMNVAMGRGLLGFGLGMTVWRWRWRVALPIAALAWLHGRYWGGLTLDPPRDFNTIIALDCALALVLLIILTFRPLQWALSIRPLVYLGKLSLAIYMLHIPVQMAILSIFHQPKSHFMWIWAGYCVIVLLLAALIEKVYIAPARRIIREKSSLRAVHAH